MHAFLYANLLQISTMDGEEDTRDPVKVHVLQGVGYIWNADGQ